MDFHFVDPEDDPANDRPVVVVTDEMMAAFAEHDRLNPPPLTENTLISPLGDVTVNGYPDDKTPIDNGIREIIEVVKSLEGSNIPCCMVAEPALIYYGTGRVMLEWIMCVPTEKLGNASEIFRQRPDTFEPFRPSVMTRHDGLEHLYPRFKFVGLVVFFIIMSSEACHIPCKPENIEHSYMGIPYPTLPVYTQSLLDSYNLVDLDDLIDGMNLTIEWGEENLDLDGTVDAEYGRWKAKVLSGGKICLSEDPMWCLNPRKRRVIWLEAASNDNKKRRQGFKYNPSYETRFWRRGMKDPRLRQREYC